MIHLYWITHEIDWLICTSRGNFWFCCGLLKEMTTILNSLFSGPYITGLNCMQLIFSRPNYHHRRLRRCRRCHRCRRCWNRIYCTRCTKIQTRQIPPSITLFVFYFPSFRIFLDAFSHIYKRACPSVRRTVSWSVRHTRVEFEQKSTRNM